MKKVKCIVSLAAMMMGASVSAELIAADSFSTDSAYINNIRLAIAPNWTNVVGTTGFAGTQWDYSTYQIMPRSYATLTHAAVTGSPSGTGTALLRPAVSVDVRTSRPLSSVPSGSTFYMSGLVLVGSLANLNNEQSVTMGLSARLTSGPTISSGVHFGVTKDSFGNLYLAAFAGGNTYTIGDALTSDRAIQTQMIVLELDMAAGNDALKVWALEQGATDLTASASITISNVDIGELSELSYFAIQAFSSGSTPTGVKMDEFRVGTTLNDVTSAIPEPATISMLGLGALLTMLGRHKFRS